jgi:hypothetical protein
VEAVSATAITIAKKAQKKFRASFKLSFSFSLWRKQFGWKFRNNCEQDYFTFSKINVRTLSIPVTGSFDGRVVSVSRSPSNL